jgi:hypothetical protein
MRERSLQNRSQFKDMLNSSRMSMRKSKSQNKSKKPPFFEVVETMKGDNAILPPPNKNTTEKQSKPVTQMPSPIIPQISRTVLTESIDQSSIPSIPSTMQDPLDKSHDLSLFSNRNKPKEKFSWKYLLKLVYFENYNKAFRMVFEYGDDLWFLRLCLLTTGKVLKNVHWRIG